MEVEEKQNEWKQGKEELNQDKKWEGIEAGKKWRELGKSSFCHRQFIICWICIPQFWMTCPIEMQVSVDVEEP